MYHLFMNDLQSFIVLTVDMIVNGVIILLSENQENHHTSNTTYVYKFYIFVY